MKLYVPRATRDAERRVPIVPDSVKRLAAKKIAVTVQSGAGARAFVSDADYASAGAEVVEGLPADADAIVMTSAPTPEQIEQLAEGRCVFAPLGALDAPATIARLAERRIDAVALELIPRTTAAQAMDVLSSQATIAGYLAVLDAAARLPRFFPMLMTAAGTIAPARCLVLGAGVAGLSAIGTARRLGAIVEGYDVRAAAKEQIESLGAKFVTVEGAADAATQGGYAREQTDEERARAERALATHVRGADVVVCTALVQGRPAPRLVTAEMVSSMKPGSVVYDLAAERGGNCAVTVPGETREVSGVTVVGALDVPSRVSVHASQMFSRNVEKLLLHLCRDGALDLARDDEILRGCLVTRAGAVVHPRLAGVAS
jgi:NAD(P) transhydrogenase subunit alpha